MNSGEICWLTSVTTSLFPFSLPLRYAMLMVGAFAIMRHCKRTHTPHL